MASLKQIKSKIRSVEKIHEVTKAMEVVSAVKMRKSQTQALQTRPYAHHAFSILKRVSTSHSSKIHDLMQEREMKRLCLIVITSDKGLAGSYNSRVLKETRKAIEEAGLAKDDISLICIGKKGREHFAKRGYTIEKFYDDPDEMLSLHSVKELADALIEAFLSSRYDCCVIVYTRFISTFLQEAVARVALPIRTEEVGRLIADIVPKKGKFSKLQEKEQASRSTQEYIFEPSPEQLLNDILPYLLNIHLYHALLEAKASEHSARLVAMKNASDKAIEMSQELTHRYNSARQAAITQEISEIIGGIGAMA